MKAAVVHDTDQAPRYDEFADPVVGEGRFEAEVLASAVHVIVRTIAAGRHYSSTTKPPFVPGLDGVVRLPDGRRVYAAGAQPPYGLLAERESTTAGDVEGVRFAALHRPGAVVARVRLPDAVEPGLTARFRLV